MRTRLVVPLAFLGAVLAGCGSSGPIGNSELASDLTKRINSSSPLVCWDKTGNLGSMSAMSYTRVCGIARSKPSVYVRTGTADKTGWCVVTPRYLAAPRCPLS